MTRLLTSDTAGNGITETFEYDDATDTVIVRHHQETQPIIDAVQREAALTGGRGEHVWHVASTPIAFAIGWAQGRGIDVDKFLYTNDYEDEWTRMLLSAPKLSPTGLKM